MNGSCYFDGRLHEQFAELRSRFSQLAELKARVDDSSRTAEARRLASADGEQDASDITKLLREFGTRVNENAREITALREEIVASRIQDVPHPPATIVATRPPVMPQATPTPSSAATDTSFPPESTSTRPPLNAEGSEMLAERLTPCFLVSGEKAANGGDSAVVDTRASSADAAAGVNPRVRTLGSIKPLGGSVAVLAAALGPMERRLHKSSSTSAETVVAAEPAAVSLACSASVGGVPTCSASLAPQIPTFGAPSCVDHACASGLDRHTCPQNESTRTLTLQPRLDTLSSSKRLHSHQHHQEVEVPVQSQAQAWAPSQQQLSPQPLRAQCRRPSQRASMSPLQCRTPPRPYASNYVAALGPNRRATIGTPSAGYHSPQPSPAINTNSLLGASATDKLLRTTSALPSSADVPRGRSGAVVGGSTYDRRPSPCASASSMELPCGLQQSGSGVFIAEVSRGRTGRAEGVSVHERRVSPCPNSNCAVVVKPLPASREASEDMRVLLTSMRTSSTGALNAQPRTEPRALTPPPLFGPGPLKAAMTTAASNSVMGSRPMPVTLGVVSTVATAGALPGRAMIS